MNIAQFCHPFWFKKVPNDVNLRSRSVNRQAFSLLNYFENFRTVEITFYKREVYLDLIHEELRSYGLPLVEPNCTI